MTDAELRRIEGRVVPYVIFKDKQCDLRDAELIELPIEVGIVCEALREAWAENKRLIELVGLIDEDEAVQEHSDDRR